MEEAGSPAPPFKKPNTQIAHFIGNMLLFPCPLNHNKTDVLTVTPAIFSLKAATSGQGTERALFFDSIFFPRCFVITVTLHLSKTLCLEHTFKISHIFRNFL